MKKLIGIVCCIAMLCIQMNAQDRLELRKGPRGREFRIGTEGEFQPVGAYNKQLRKVLKDYRPSGRMSRKSHAKRVSGEILTLTGTAGILGMLAIGHGSRPNSGWGPVSPEFEIAIISLAAGALGLSAGIPLLIVSKYQLRKAVRLYNSQFDGLPPVGDDKKPDIRLGITPHGVGMVMNW